MKICFKKRIALMISFILLFTSIFMGTNVPQKSYAASKEINIYVEKPSNWGSIWIWYDSDLSTSSWDTTTLKTAPGDLELYRDNWYKKTINSEKIQFLFNDGTWNNKLSNNGNDFITTNDIWVKSDGSYTLVNPFDDGNNDDENGNDSIKLHYYSSWGQSYLYYWGTTPNGLKNTWPGDQMTAEGDNWYSYELEETATSNIIFNNGNGQQTPDLSRSSGEWWYKDNTWYDSKPTTETGGGGSTGGTTGGTTDDGNVNPGTRTDFRDETIYFVITTRFYDGDSSNNYRTSEDDKAGNSESDPSWRGDFKGLIEKLDYIKALGFTAIWITPVVTNDSGYDYHGYHAYDFSTVDSRYESDGATYQDLIDACHSKGIKIIQDVVFNHTCNWGEKNLLQINDDVYTNRNKVVMNGTGDPDNIYHHNGFCGGGDYDNFSAQNKTIADDCFDLNTENPTVYNYLTDCYTKYINMGVDGFRVDTTKHISRLTLNSVFLPKFKEAGGDDFFMFGEVCTKGHDVWYRDAPPISTPFYTWADDSSWINKWSSTDQAANQELVEEHYYANMNTSEQPTSNNAFLIGNEYHTPDRSKSSGLESIDFQMHWSFINATSAFNTALGEDKYFNDSTMNVVYVDSHDYAPDECQTVRYNGGTDAWAENLNLMFTFRGIPCLYYGSEIEFQSGKPIDKGPTMPLSETGRAYFGDNIEGTVNVTDFAEYDSATGTMAETLNYPLAKHIQRLNLIRKNIPALRKGQYSTEGVSGNIAFKRRYTNASEGVDSFVLVSITEGATFTGIPNGKYVDAITGDVKNVTNGTLSIDSCGKGNMRIYVLSLPNNAAPGKIGEDGAYLK